MQALQGGNQLQEQGPAWESKTLVVKADLPAELRVMSMLEQVMRGGPMEEDEAARVAVWFFDKYGA